MSKPVAFSLVSVSRLCTLKTLQLLFPSKPNQNACLVSCAECAHTHRKEDKQRTLGKPKWHLRWKKILHVRLPLFSFELITIVVGHRVRLAMWQALHKRQEIKDGKWILQPRH